MGYEILVGMIVQGICTGLGVALGTWAYKKFLEPSLDKGHETLGKIPITPKFTTIQTKQQPYCGGVKEYQSSSKDQTEGDPRIRY